MTTISFFTPLGNTWSAVFVWSGRRHKVGHAAEIRQLLFTYFAVGFLKDRRDSQNIGNIFICCQYFANFAPKKVVIMNNCSQYIMEYALSHPQFDLSELYAHIDMGEAIDISHKTISWHLTKLIESGRLQRVARGKYAIREKQQFSVFPTEEQRSLNEELKIKWPYAHFCIYNGNIISPLQHHLSANNITYIETEREAVTAVFNHLRDEGKSAYLRPTREFIYNYIDLSHSSIFVKPLITESPVQESNGILVPTLEKLLIDLQKDKDFFYLQEAEGENIFQNALSLYSINESRLLRYASRRGIRKEIETIIQTINTHD